MNMSIDTTLTVANAPRDVAELAKKGAYKLRKLANELGLLNDPVHKSAFMNGKADEMAQLVMAGLQAWDSKQSGQVAPAPTNGAANANGVTPPAQMALPTTMPNIAIPGAQSAPQPTPEPEQPTTGKGRRSPSTDGSEALKKLEAALANNTQAIDTLAKTVMATKASADKADAAPLLQAISSLNQVQLVTLSLLTILAENVLGAPQGEVLKDSIDNVKFTIANLQEQAGKAG